MCVCIIVLFISLPSQKATVNCQLNCQSSCELPTAHSKCQLSTVSWTIYSTGNCHVNGQMLTLTDVSTEIIIEITLQCNIMEILTETVLWCNALQSKYNGNGVIMYSMFQHFPGLYCFSWVFHVKFTFFSRISILNSTFWFFMCS